MTQVTAKVLHLSGKAAAVLVGCEAYVVDADDVGGAVVGNTVSIDISALETAAPYGIDWSIVCPDGLVISPEALQALMCKYGIITMDDLVRNASALQAILAQETKRLGAELYRLAKSSHLGG